MASPTQDLLLQAAEAKDVIKKSILQIEADRRRQMLAAEGLFIYPEYFQGINKQISLLRRLRDDLSGKRPESALEKIGSRLRSAYSLNPKSKAARDCINQVFFLLNNQEIQALNAIKPTFWLANISCEARLSMALASFDSFRECHDLMPQIIVIGTKNSSCDFKVTFNGTVLALPVPDSYEGLALKVAMLSYILSDHTNACGFFKIDDDIRLTSEQVFRGFIARLCSAEGDYLGFPIRDVSHDSFWHGWHIGKCSDKMLEDYGMSCPLPTIYANGGSGYAIRGNAIKAICYAYLAQNRFLESSSGWVAEDAIVGLLLHLQRVPLCSLGPNTEVNLGFSSEEMRLARAEGDSWSIFQERLKCMGL